MFNYQVKELENQSLRTDSEIEENNERIRVMTEHLRSIQQELQQTQVGHQTRSTMNSCTLSLSFVINH